MHSRRGSDKNLFTGLKKMRAGFQRNEIHYLLLLRLIPLFQFWVVNIVPALLNIFVLQFFLHNTDWYSARFIYLCFTGKWVR